MTQRIQVTEKAAEVIDTLREKNGELMFYQSGASFSLEIPLGLRFVVKSRLFTDEEIAVLPATHKGPVAE